MIEWVQSQFTSLVSTIVTLIMFVTAFIVGIRFGGGNKILSWVIGIVALVTMVIIVGPVVESLDERSCALNADKCR